MTQDFENDLDRKDAKLLRKFQHELFQIREAMREEGYPLWYTIHDWDETHQKDYRGYSF